VGVAVATFSEVISAERNTIRARAQTKAARTKEFAHDAGTDQHKPSVGLAFSGGGIRSATFNLGVLQQLASANLLDKIDYLSTVSGGGYIGSWLVSWISRAPGGVKEVQQRLGHYQESRAVGDPIAEPEQVSFLREYSNYLTPRLGFFGADTWTAIATYLRNVLLNQIILIAFLGAIVFLPWCILRSSHWLSRHVHLGGDFERAEIAAAIAFVCLLLAICWGSVQTARCSFTKNASPRSASQNFVIALTVLPVFGCAAFTMVALWLAPDDKLAAWPLQDWALLIAAAYGTSHLLGVVCRYFVVRKIDDPNAKLTLHQWFFIPLSAFIAGSVGGLTLSLVDNNLVQPWKNWSHGFAHALAWGPGLIVFLFLVVGTLHIGFLKLLIQNEEQEWWGRMAGLLIVITIFWTCLFALTFFVPWLLIVYGDWFKAKVVLGAGWAATTIFGVLSGKSSQTSGKNSDGYTTMDILAMVSPYVFVIGLFVLLSWGAFFLAERELFRETGQAPIASTQQTSGNVTASAVAQAGSEKASASISSPSVAACSAAESKGALAGSAECTALLQQEFWGRTRRFGARWMWIKFCGLFLIAALVSWRVDINIFSMNLLYRNRLVRCYLGASRLNSLRHPNPFTGFDPRDDIQIAELTPEKGYDGPYPIICASLNVTHGERLAWQERKAESFTFTPRFCGYEFVDMHPTTRAKSPGGYHESATYAYPKDKQNPSHASIGGVRVGTAISISGAAASPNMGFHTSPPLAFLMTLFNVRLGWWLANSRYANEELATGKPEGGPPFSLFYLLNELLASTTDRSDYVYLSDGGHFENLAIYELVRRKCKYIIACDGDADGAVTFGDLGNAIRKCRSDFGVEISLDSSSLRPDSNSGFAGAHGVVGTIRYPGPDIDDNWGHILYIKPAITKDLPRDVLAYRDSQPPFPYQTTADQWFDESQFESYRKLGEFSFKSLWSGNSVDRSSPDLKTFFAGFAS
jgi:Patatin-like phospholipase